jgi:lipid II:glycine glycyltransferase (peptidoglycan interpeptide bridge formation enzyme)
MIRHEIVAQSQHWNDAVASLPNAHVLQTWEWGQIKSRFGWKPIYMLWRDESEKVVAAALVLERIIHLMGIETPMRVMYVPKGPILNWSDIELRHRVLSDLKTTALDEFVFFIKIDPDVTLGTGVPDQNDSQDNPLGQDVIAELMEMGWRFSEEQIQFRNTVTIDLTPDIETLLANMKQKTRYNVRLAGRRGVVVREAKEEDLELLYGMYVETSIRDDFVIRDKDYYRTVWSTFMRSGIAQPIIAEVDEVPIGALIPFCFADKAWYLYGMSRVIHRDKMPNYLLQWDAMCRAKANGCRIYDLWGAPDEFNESDSMWGVYRFKQGLGGEVVRHIGAWDLPIKPIYYRLYVQFLPRILKIMRIRGRERTSQSVDL